MNFIHDKYHKILLYFDHKSPLVMATECLGLRSVWALLLVTWTCNLNSKSVNHEAPTDHRPSICMTQLSQFNRESVCYSKILVFPILSSVWWLIYLFVGENGRAPEFLSWRVFRGRLSRGSIMTYLQHEQRAIHCNHIHILVPWRDRIEIYIAKSRSDREIHDRVDKYRKLYYTRLQIITYLYKVIFQWTVTFGNQFVSYLSLTTKKSRILFSTLPTP